MRTVGLIVLIAAINSGETLLLPVADLSIPRAVLAAHWAHRDAYAVLVARLAKELRAVEKNAAAEAGVKTLLTGDALKGQEVSEKSDSDAVVVYDRKILEETKMTDSITMVTVRVTNVSPLPIGVSLSVDEEKTRAEGEHLRYRLVLTPSGWRISQVYSYQAWRSENDENLRWSPLYSDDGAGKLYMYVHINAFSN